MTVQTPTDKRFHRAHVKPIRRRRLAGACRLAIRAVGMMAVTGLGIFWLADVVRDSSLLRINTLTVAGNDRLSTGEVLALAGELRNQSILLADLDISRERLLTSGWVQDATLRRRLPATIEIAITEREPVMLGRLSGRLYLIDAVGTVIDEYSAAFEKFDLPIVDGLFIGDEAAVVVDHTRGRLAARVIGVLAGRRDLSDRISQIDVHDPYDVVVLLSGDPALIHLGTQRFVERLQRYLELTPTLRARVPKIDYVDLRFERRVYVGPMEKVELIDHAGRLATSRGGAAPSNQEW